MLKAKPVVGVTLKVNILEVLAVWNFEQDSPSSFVAVLFTLMQIV